MLTSLRNSTRNFLSNISRTYRTHIYCRRAIKRSKDTTGTVSMVTSNYLNVDTFPLMLRDWIDFVGRRPYEIVVTDGGTVPDAVDMYRKLFEEGLIDKLFLMQPKHPENTRKSCFIQEYYAGVMASGDYLLFFRPDTIPYRNGHEDWLREYIEILAANSRLFSITGSSPGPGYLGEISNKFWCLEHTSENFALLPRKNHVEAIALCNDFWCSGWRGTNPFSNIGEVAERCMIESAWDVYCRKKGMHVLMQKEDDTWSIFHTNARGDNLITLRQRCRLRKGLESFYNRSGSFLCVE